MQPFFHLAVYMIDIPLVFMPLAPCCQFLKRLIAISRSAIPVADHYPGHMPGVDSGAVNDKYGVTEAGIVKEIGAGVQQYLNRVGYDCLLVQSDNLCGESPNYTNICASANGWQADLFLSIHCNAAAAEEAQGTETLVYSSDSGEACGLAECIQNQIVQSLGTVDRGVKERPGLAVLRETDMPAVLVETAFITNEEDVQLLMDQKDEFARAIARGVTDYIARKG